MGKEWKLEFSLQRGEKKKVCCGKGSEDKGARGSERAAGEGREMRGEEYRERRVGRGNSGGRRDEKVRRMSR